MKRITWLALPWLALLADSAHAAKSMAEKEQAQTIVWIVEAASFIVIIAVSLLVWRISTRAAASRRPKPKE